MNEEQVKKIRKILKTDLKDYLKIMKENKICALRFENEEKTLGIKLASVVKPNDKRPVKTFDDKVDTCLKNIEKIEDIKSHMVGKFYIANNDDGEHFKSGDFVEKGKVIAFIDTMNIKHEINAVSDSKIINILVDSGKPVEYGQPLIQYKVN